MQHRSISQRLKKAKSPEVKQEVALDWAANWQTEQLQLIQLLEQAVKRDDYDNLCIVTGQLKAVTQKRLEALPKVIKALTK
jgi:hypothetical protein